MSLTGLRYPPPGSSPTTMQGNNRGAGQHSMRYAYGRGGAGAGADQACAEDHHHHDDDAEDALRTSYPRSEDTGWTHTTGSHLLGDGSHSQGHVQGLSGEGQQGQRARTTEQQQYYSDYHQSYSRGVREQQPSSTMALPPAAAAPLTTATRARDEEKARAKLNHEGSYLGIQQQHYLQSSPDQPSLQHQASYAGGKSTLNGSSDAIQTEPVANESRNRTTISAIFKGYATRNQLAFLTAVFLQVAATVVMIAFIWTRYRDDISEHPKLDPAATNDQEELLRKRSITVYLAIFLFGAVFEIITVLDALRLNNTMQLLGVCLFTAAMMVYAALLDGQISNAMQESVDAGTFTQLYHHIRPFVWAMPIINGVATLVLAWFTWKLYQDFGMEVWHSIGAGRQMKRMFTQYQIFLCVLKFDFFFFVGFSLQYMILVLSVQEVEFIITIVAFPVSIACLFLAVVAVRRELRWLTWIIILVECAGLAYFVFKLFRLFQPSQSLKYDVSRRTLAVFSALAIAMLLLTFVYTVICYRNFGNGLKDLIPPYWGENKDTSRSRLNRKASVGPQGALDNHPSRMSID